MLSNAPDFYVVRFRGHTTPSCSKRLQTVFAASIETGMTRSYETGSPILLIVLIKLLFLISAWIYNPMSNGSGVSRSPLCRMVDLDSSSAAFLVRLFTHLKLIIIHQTHYQKSDWSRAFNQFTIACELDMINALSAADNTLIMSSSTSAWLLSPSECSQKQNG